MIRSNFSVLSSAFDALVAILIQVGKILPKLFVCGWNNVSVLNRRKSVGQVANGGNVKFILV